MTAAISAGAMIAIGATAAVGAGATIYAANKSADATRSASNAAISEQQSALTQQEQLAAPYTAQGQKGVQTYNALNSANPAQVQQTLQNTPGYQATMTQGTEAAMRSSAASGLNLSGNQVTGVEQFGAQLGDQTYQQAINNAMGQEQIGQAAAAGTAANIGQAATNEGNIQIGQGANQANITANEVAGLTRAESGASNQYLTYNTLQNLNNPAGGGNPYNLGGSTPMAPAGSNLTYDASGNITGSVPMGG